MRIEATAEAIYQNLTLENRLTDSAVILFRLTEVAFDYLNPNGEELTLYSLDALHPACREARSQGTGWTDCTRCEAHHLKLAIERRSLQLYRCHADLRRIVLPVFSAGGGYIGALRSRAFTMANSAAARQKLCPVLNDSKLVGVISYLQQQAKILQEHQWQFDEGNSSTRPATDRLTAITSYLKKNSARELKLETTARKFGWSVSSFCRIFRAETDMTFTQYLNWCRLEAAEKLLTDPALRIATIAFRTGFGSVSQFNRVFKESHGVSPQTYRRRSSPPTVFSQP